MVIRKGISLVCVASSLVLVVGCSSTDGGSAPAAGKETSSVAKSTPAAEATASSAGKGEKTELTFYILSDWEKNINQVSADFMKENPNISIKMQSYPFRQLFETMEVKLGSKSPEIDIVLTDGPLVSNYNAKGYLEPLNDLISKKAQTNYIPSSLEAGSVNGTLLAAPMNTSSQVLYYNKDIFKEKGETVPDFDIAKRWTWEQVVAAGKKLTYDKNGDGQPDVFGFTFEQLNRPYQLLSLGNGLGGKAISEDGLKSDGFTNSPEMVQAGKFYYDLYNTFKISPKITADETVDYFATGKVAMFVGGTWDVGKFTDAKINFGIAPHPYFEGKKVATPTGSWHVGVSKYSTHKDAAAKFIEYLTAGKGAETWVNASNDVPARIDLLNKIDSDPNYQNFPKNIMKLAASEANNTAVPRPKSPGYLEWETLMDKAFSDIKNGTEPKKALDGAVTQIDRQLAKYSVKK
ncbi:extracellular solute-binding protein [Paenibacillus sp. LMG 31461]|uniref:Extracellular solute-binding protein n=1 Tax=Paenibacillus plantarum TaxID=2654975 RepID=A0ABX1X969_9BACL|nr:sugar ABC transporter substrate-binding protein [Paenibacillus plantarum]NOU64568.1 extracellular solute-binding protein [Paenibacillus plantarum]